eukprot:Em0003g1188a
MATTCWARTVECNKCGKIGHIARVCRSNKHPKKGRREVEQAKRDLKVVCDDEETEIGDTHMVYALGNEKCDPFIVPVYINGVCVHLELDTGASMTLISKKTLDKLWPRETRPKLRSTSTRLRTYRGESLEVLGIAVVDVVYRDQQAKLKLVVVKQDGPCLLGRDWLKAIKFDVSFIHAVTASVSNIQQLLNVHATLFEEKLGLFKGVVAKLLLNPIGEKQPKFYKARTVPFALKERIEKELGCLQAVGIISPVHSSEWAAPIVPVVKQDGSVWICGDYKLTANRVITLESYPIPRIEELFASLSGGVKFSKLDLKNAYLQAIETLLQGIPYTCAYFDDIVVTGKTDDEHLQNLQLVFQKLESVGLKLNKEKCVFMAPSIEYLGHQIDKDGLHPTDEKVTCIKQAPTPSTITELKAFMGLLNYYGKFIPNLATVLAPLYRLLQKDTKWNWGRDQQEAFKCAKELLQSSTLLVHYDPKRQLVLTCDASPFGVGAVLAHIMDDGSERPVGYASRSLSQAEKGYSQLDKEALAIVFGVTKFNSYLYGRPFTIYSDHKPLMYLFSEHKGIPTMASARVLRWAVTLSAYQYSIRYKPGSEVCHADALSRLPIPSSDTDCIPGSIIGLIDFMSSTPMSSELVKKHTQRDPVLSRVCQFVLKGWTEKKLGEPFFPYESRKYELSVQDDACSKWLDVHVMKSISSSATIEKLRSIFAIHGLPHKLVTDNGPAFISSEFKTFMDYNGIVHIRSAPYHPSTNGLAERAVQTLKDGLHCIKDGTIETRLARFLSKYRLTPHSTTGLSPSEMLLGRRPRSRLDLMNPDLAQKVLSNQLQQKRTHDNSKQARSFKVGEEVYVRSFNNINHWIPGSILATTGPLSYKISLANGVVIKRHVDHVKARYSRDQSFQVPASIPHLEIAVRSQDQTNLEPVNLPAEAIENAGDLDPELHHDSRVRAPEAPTEHSEEIEVPDATTLTEQPLRRSTRIRHPPICYGTELCVNFEEGEM